MFSIQICPWLLHDSHYYFGFCRFIQCFKEYWRLVAGVFNSRIIILISVVLSNTFIHFVPSLFFLFSSSYISPFYLHFLFQNNLFSPNFIDHPLHCLISGALVFEFNESNNNILPHNLWFTRCRSGLFYKNNNQSPTLSPISVSFLSGFVCVCFSIFLDLGLFEFVFSPYCRLF